MAEVRIPSGSRIPGVRNPVNVTEIGNPGQPTELIIHNGKLYIYNTAGQTLVDGGVIQTQGVAVGLKSWVHNITFSATDKDTASWNSGTVYFGDGSSQAIITGNTGNITEKTYIYYDGTSVLKKTTNANFIADSYILLTTIEPADEDDEKAVITVSRLPSGTISADQIVAGYMEFDRARGGTLQLGGKNNVSGIFSLKDAANVERIKMDKDGMEITGGRVSIKDDDAESVLDSKGLVGGTAFNHDVIIKSANQSLNLGWQDITELTFTITLTRIIPVLFFTNITVSNDDGYSSVRMKIGASTYYPSSSGFRLEAETVGYLALNFSNVHIINLPVGTTTVKWQASRDTSSSSTVIKDMTNFGYLTLGK